MRQNRWLLVVAGLLAAMAIYCGAFAWWWTSSASRDVARGGKKLHEVKFQRNAIYLRTEPVWQPAFWFMGMAFGYKRVGLIATEKSSVILFVKAR